MQFITATISKTGGRKQNQDYCHYSMKDRASCWVLADGLGGHRGGEISSRLAVDNILESFEINPEISSRALKNTWKPRRPLS